MDPEIIFEDGLARAGSPGLDRLLALPGQSCPLPIYCDKIFAAKTAHSTYWHSIV